MTPAQTAADIGAAAELLEGGLIAKALARCDEPESTDGHCALCRAFICRAGVDEHYPDCPWRRARELYPPDPFDGLTGPEAAGADPTRSTPPQGPTP